MSADPLCLHSRDCFIVCEIVIYCCNSGDVAMIVIDYMVPMLEFESSRKMKMPEFTPNIY